MLQFPHHLCDKIVKECGWYGIKLTAILGYFNFCWCRYFEFAMHLVQFYKTVFGQN